LLIPAQATTQAGANNRQPLILGVLPFRSPVALLKRFAPLRDHLQQKIGRPVILETASNFDEFVSRSQARRYDFLLTAPHFTLLAIDSGKYEVTATYLKPLAAGISVKRDSNIRSLKQLEGQRISTPPDIAIITMAGKSYLKKHLKKQPQYINYKSHNASLDAMLVGNSVAAIASLNPTRQYIQRDIPLRIIATTPPLPGMGLLVASDLDESIKSNYRDALINMHKDPHGKAALKKMDYSGYRPVDKREFESTRIFLQK
ncbi:MAG: phosphate/phosphite/phosphonate ABC transporter substrate-binding protein, partial [Thioalkalispiraceae bacterium]